MADVIGKKIYEVDVDGRGAATGLREVEKAAAKTGSALKTTLKEGGGGLIGTLNDLTGGLAGKFKDASEALGGVTKGFGALKGAIIATGIGALLVGVGLLIQNWSEVVGFMNRANGEARALVDSAKADVEIQQKKLDAISGQENILKLQGKTEREILELKLKQTDEIIAAQEAQLLAQQEVKRQQIEAAQRNKSILEGIITFLTAPLQVLLGAVDAVGKAVGKEFGLREGLNDAISGLIFDPEDVAKENDATIAETQAALDKLKNDRAGFQLAINAIDKKGSDERKKILQDELKEQDRLRKEADAKRKEFDAQRVSDEIAEQEEKEALIQAIADARAEVFKSQQQKEIDAVRAKYGALIQAAKDNDIDHRELLVAQNYELQKIQSDANLALAATNDAREKDEIAREKRISEQKMALLQGGFDALIALNEAFEGKSRASQKRAFQTNKALRVAQTLITTYQNATAAYASQIIPGEPTSVVRGAIAAGIATAQGLAQVAAIAKTRFDDGGGGSAPSAGGGGGASFSGGGGGSNQIPFNPVGQQAQAGQQATPQPVQAYVLETNVTSAQMAQQKIDERASL